MIIARPEVQPTFDLSQTQYLMYVLSARFDELRKALASKGEPLVVHRLHWPTEVTGDVIDSLPGVLRMVESDHSNTTVLLDLDGCVVRAVIDSGSVYLTVAGAGPEVLLVVELLQHSFPKTNPPSGKRPVTFWTYGRQGPESRTRTIEVPTWSAIEENYSASVRSELDLLMAEDFRPHGGQLILLDGPPGTGKTYLLRALIERWKSWADFHCVVDPEKFFGEHSDYLMQVLFHGDNVLISSDDDFEEQEDQEKWLVLILEDSGELLTQDAKERVGQALSRLLNVVDGIIGQGLKVLLIVTTNEEIKSLHPAVSRPGRCAAAISFVPFPAEEAVEWLERRYVGEVFPGPGGLTLADMYAMVEERELARRTPKPVGFLQ